jgi:putative ATP-binding cassette transporter
MRLFWLLCQVSILKLALAVFSSILSGFAAMGAIICVFESLRTGNVLWWQFGAVAGFAMGARELARVTLNGVAAKSVLRLRRQLVRWILHIPLLELERIGSARLLVALTGDLASIAPAVRNLVSICASAAFLLACVGWLVWLTPKRAAVIALLLVASIVVAIQLRRLEMQQRHATRLAWDHIVRVFTMVLDGVKQLKLNRQLARQVLRAFKDRASIRMHSGGRRLRQSDIVGTWIQFMFYVILGVAVFGPYNDEASLKRGYGFGLLALLHIRGPLRSLITDSRAFAEASVALKRIADLGLMLWEDQERVHFHHLPGPPRGWRSLDMHGVTFRYDRENAADDFALGPLNLSLMPGEIVFVGGGNGSGKTTFAKLLTGLYPPTSGRICFDGIEVNEENVSWFRSKFSAVFADFCLFEGVVDLRQKQVVEEIERLAVRLKLDRWMAAAADAGSAATPLSAGERRRVALLMALLEDRPILIFDEWAAEQDPVHKDLFYVEILPRIRNSGKLVVVISHDDRYFHTANRVLWLERGEPPIWRSPNSFADSPKAIAMQV